MLNLLTKTKPWMVASLLVATTVFGQAAETAQSCAPKSDAKSSASCPKADCKPKAPCAPCPQPCPPTQMCPSAPAACCPAWPVPVLNAAYNYPARTQTRCPWDIFVDASFIYWQPVEENLELGIIGTVPTGGDETSQLVGNVVGMDFDFKPGFKVGVGAFFDYDSWDIHAEYTWFHNTNSKSASYDATATSLQAFYSAFVHPAADLGGANVYDSVSQKWKLGMDLIDLDVGRWYYVGTKLVFRTGLGARGAFIHQNLNQTLGNVAIYAFGDANTATIKAKSHSWAVGPRVSLDTNWMLGCGFRMFGCGGLDLLYTRYTTLGYDSTNSDTTDFGIVDVDQRNLGCVRTHCDINVGFAWGTYWDCNNWYTDVSLGYQFQVFFDQNMFRHFTGGGSDDGASYANSNSPNGNLYLQGLTAQFALNF